MNLTKIMGAVVGVAALLGAGAARADLYPDFTVSPAAYTTGALPSFTADKITGNYAERITFNGDGTFDTSLLLQLGQFVQNDGTTALGGDVTGLNDSAGYKLYALFTGSGTNTATSFTLTSGSLQVYLDPGRDTTFTAAASQSSTATWGTTVGTADALVATGNVLVGQGNIGCNVGNNCGSFGQVATFSLTSPVGTGFFTSPRPFYNLVLNSGQLNGFVPAGTLTLNGSADVIFATPEPSALALVGLALVGAGLVRRRKQA